jgi:hypothetical protein
MTDTASRRASPQNDAAPYHVDGDGIGSEAYVVSNSDTNFSLTVMFGGLRMYVDIFTVNLERSRKSWTNVSTS